MEWRLEVNVDGKKRGIPCGRGYVGIPPFNDVGYAKDDAWMTVPMMDVQQAIRKMLGVEGPPRSVPRSTGSD